MTKIREQICEAEAKVMADMDLQLKNKDLFDCLTKLFDKLNKNYLIVSKQMVKENIRTITGRAPLDMTELKQIFTVGSAVTYMDSDVNKAVLKDYLTNGIFNELEKEASNKYYDL